MVVQVWEYLTGQCLQSLNTAGGTEVVSILQITERRRFMVTGWNRTISVFEDKVSYHLSLDDGRTRTV